MGKTKAALMPLNMGAAVRSISVADKYGTWAGSTRERHEDRVVRRAIQHCQESLTSEPADQSEVLKCEKATLSAGAVLDPKSDQAMLEHRYIEEMLHVPSGRCQIL
jgi:hypothetical protein